MNLTWTRKNLKKSLLAFFLVFILLFLFSALILPKRFNLRFEKEKKERISNEREAIYDIITKEDQNPKITKVIINPLYPDFKEKQIIKVEVQEKENLPITTETKLEIKIIDDLKEYMLFPEIKKINGNENFTLILWEGEWEFEAKIEKKYLIEIKAQNSKGQHHLVTLTIK